MKLNYTFEDFSFAKEKTTLLHIQTGSLSTLDNSVLRGENDDFLNIDFHVWWLLLVKRVTVVVAETSSESHGNDMVADV